MNKKLVCFDQPQRWFANYNYLLFVYNIHEHDISMYHTVHGAYAQENRFRYSQSELTIKL